MKCNYKPQKLTLEEQSEFAVPSSKSTLPLIYKLKYWNKNKKHKHRKNKKNYKIKEG